MALSLYGDEITAELRGIAKAAGLDLADLVLANAIFEVSAACTSVVATLPGGNICHGRNLDYPEVYLRATACFVDFVDGSAPGGERLLFSGAMVLPCVGVWDGIRAGAYSISLNTRHFSAHQQPVGDKPGRYRSYEGGRLRMLRRNWRNFFWERGDVSPFGLPRRAMALPLMVRHTLMHEASHFLGHIFLVQLSWIAPK